ncbi:MAG: alpha-amylase family protein [Bdellovibrio sp.]|nr:alpha-amylase family protein [Bdellovibrio sp.]
MVKRLLVTTLLLASSAAFASPRTVFVQLFEWPWKDIARECEVYLGPAGFSAVQVSPPHEHIHFNNSWWERYQVVSYKLESRSGTEAEFADMVRRCQNAGVDVYADAVLNHMTGIPGGTGSGGTSFTHYNYPGLYSYNDFHHCNRNGNDNIVNYSDLYELQNCELVDLADLATESPYVQQKMADYLNHLLDLGVNGFRLDAAKHIPAKDLAAITSRLKRSAYIYQEIIYDPSGPVKYSDYTYVGDVTAYDYPNRLGGSIKGKHLSSLMNMGQGYPASDDSIVFVTNHDLERTGDGSILRYNSADQNIYRLAQIFMLAYPYGYPQVYSGFSFTNYDEGPPVGTDLRTLGILDNNSRCSEPWTCEHRLPEVAAMVDFRNATDKAFYISNWWTNNSDLLSFSRGNLGFIVLNFSDRSVTQTFQTGLPKGSYCNLTGPSYVRGAKTCSDLSYTVDNYGWASVTLAPYSSLVLVNRTPSKKSK